MLVSPPPVDAFTICEFLKSYKPLTLYCGLRGRALFLSIRVDFCGLEVCCGPLTPIAKLSFGLLYLITLLSKNPDPPIPGAKLKLPKLPSAPPVFFYGIIE